MERTKEEYGGFLPLELPKGKGHYYSKYKNVLQFNTIKAAIPLIQKILNIDTIYAPYYLCPNVIAELKNSFKKVEFFNIDKNLLPLIADTNEKLIYLVNYFGIMDSKIRKYIKNNSNTVFILDNAHSFYFKPILKDNVFNLYSCKKFFGVPDGGYLITKEKIADNLPKIFANDYSGYLIKSLEEGTNSCYQEKKEVDQKINSSYSGISFFSERILSGIDYNYIKKVRATNFSILNKHFSKYNNIQCESSSIPYLYPLFLTCDIRKELIQKKIYVPTLWGQCLNQNNLFEKELTEKTIFIPLDQRYDKMDINYIVSVINSLL